MNGAGIDGSGTARARCVLAPNPSLMTLDGTNTWLIAEPGAEPAIVVDPGPDDEGHLARVRAAAGEAGQRIQKIVLTHGHADHSAGARRLAGLTGAPVLAVDPAHRLGAASALGPGDAVRAGGCELRVIETPGHTSDSVSLLLEADGAVLTGDTVLGRGTTVIAGDGNLADYLRSLDRLRALADAPGLKALLPGHGPLLDQPAQALDYYIAHRQERLLQVEAAIAAGNRALADIVAAVYVDVDRALWPFAEWSVRAQLVYLAERGGLPPGMHVPQLPLPGPLPQPLGVEKQDRLGVQLDPAARDEVGEGLVDRLP
jgi:glyoxylase-like metal-dependent hydrolase (beta-lactamase superfamily II)